MAFYSTKILIVQYFHIKAIINGVNAPKIRIDTNQMYLKYIKLEYCGKLEMVLDISLASL